MTGSHLWSFPPELFGALQRRILHSGATRAALEAVFCFSFFIVLFEAGGRSVCVKVVAAVFSGGLELPWDGRRERSHSRGQGGRGFPLGAFPLLLCSCAGRDPAAGAAGKSGREQHGPFRPLAPPRRGWDRDSRAGLGWQRGGESCSPRGAFPGHSGITVLEKRS